MILIWPCLNRHEQSSYVTVPIPSSRLVPAIRFLPLISLRRGKVSSESEGMRWRKMYPETSVISLKKVKFASVSVTVL